jgi:uncharacterized protein (DUF302 family)
MYVASDSFVFRMDRRTFVRLSSLTAAGLAGCVGDGGDGDGGDGDESGGDQNQTQQADGETDDNETQEQDTDTDMNGDNGNGLVTQTADEETVDETVGRLTDTIESDDNPLSLLYQLDHRENAASVDMDLPPTVVIMFGNPAAGTPLMRESRTIGVDLPQKMLVWEDEEEVKITYNDPEHIAERHGIEGQKELLGNIRNALDALAAGEME